MKSPPYMLSIDHEFGHAEWMRTLSGEADDVFIAERYKLLERVARGSFGVVYAAHDVELDRKVAVKVMRAGDPDADHREGRALAALSHTSVVSIYDHGAKDDYRWLVLELLEGPTLFDWCADRDSRAILARYLEAGEGLAAAHLRGLVHFDFKATNVRINGDGRAVVVDFGLARNLDSLGGLKSDEEKAYRSGGTLEYMAPERLRGRRADTSSDQFSFCVALWEALAGENPFGPPGLSVEERLVAIARGPKGRPRASKRVRRLLERGLAPLPGDRWTSMRWLLDGLADAQARAWRLWAAAAVIVLVAGVVSWWVVPEAPPLSVEFDGAEFEQIELELLQALQDQDYPLVQQELRNGYAVSRQERRQEEFARVAMEVALGLESDGRLNEAVTAWWMVLTISREFEDLERAEMAKAHVVALEERL